jgi:hypothetical protein
MFFTKSTDFQAAGLDAEGYENNLSNLQQPSIIEQSDPNLEGDFSFQHVNNEEPFLSLFGSWPF